MFITFIQVVTGVIMSLFKLIMNTFDKNVTQKSCKLQDEEMRTRIKLRD